jgi:hypothetical protein
LAQDVTERKNLATQQPDIVERLRKLHEEWVRELREVGEVERQ